MYAIFRSDKESTMPATVAVSLRDRIAAYQTALTAEDIAKLFQVEKDSIYKKARTGDIPSFRIGTSVRFDPKQLADWLDRQ
jgi:excisionase family DNA binding protein